MAPAGTFLTTDRQPSDRVMHLFHTGNLARSWRLLRIETMAQRLGMDAQAVIRIYGPFELPPEPESMVYMVAESIAPSDGTPVKIGYSRSIRTRLESLQSGSVSKLWLVTYLRGGRPLERELHERLAHYRIREEWFEMCPAVRDEFASRRTPSPQRLEAGSPTEGSEA